MKMQKLIYVTKGSKIVLNDKAYCYRYAFFTLERPGVYLYTYAYEENECWCTYRKEYSQENWMNTDMIFDDGNLPAAGEGYIRLSVKMKAQSGEGIGTAEEGKASVIGVTGGTDERVALQRKEQAFLARTDVQDEIARTVRAVEEKRTKDCLVFTLLTDTHYVVNGNWETCAATIEAVNAQISPDGVIHLGDLTDGLLDRETCREYSHRVLDRITGWGKPFYMTIGNHDVNYFRSNPHKLSGPEQYDCYLRGIVSGELTEDQLWYDVSFPERKLAFLFLHSYDNEEKLRYGFTQGELDWVVERLERLPKEYQVVIFSHEAPLARLDYWASEIRNGEMLTELLDRWNRTHDNRILAFVHGHTHADYIYRERTFPIVSLGCSKVEYFEDKRPEGAVRPVRIEGEVSQELWDTMVINTKERKIDFVRFGAGTDRSTKPEKKVKIWAHRGASGYAPENTLEAFALARELGADGVELDVQFTKDRQLVVIHDERIDRVSDGSGYVADYTLDELRNYNFNRTYPSCIHADIPTLREVLELLAPTALTVNIELKTGINPYPGIERETVRLVQELGMEERVIYSSFSHRSVLTVRKLTEVSETGFLCCDGILDMAAYAQERGVTAVHPAWYLMKNPGFVQACADSGRKIHVWTVNDRDHIGQTIQRGADAVITNYPDLAYEVIYGKKLALPENKVTQEQPEKDETNTSADKAGVGNAGKKHALLHLLGVTYGKVRKIFVAIDRIVQRAAGKQ